MIRHDATHASGRRGTLRRGAGLPLALAAVLAPALGACGSARPEPEPLPIVAVGPPAPAQIDTAGTGVRDAQATLALADSLMAAGAIEPAAAAYGWVAALPGEGSAFPALHALRARALWGTALTHLLAPEATTSSEPTREILHTLTEGYAGTPEAAQAGVLAAMLRELDRLRADGMRKEEHIRRLNETVEQLKRIDMSRRPSGGP